MFAHLSPARRRFFAALGGLAVFALVAVVVAIVRSDDPADPVAQGTLGPVLLVPGYGGSEAWVEELVAALDAEGRKTVVVSLLGDGRGDLSDQAEALDQAADRAMQQAGATTVDVIGYSAGGVIARLWVADLGGDEVARRVVMLGSPNHGTNLAGVASDLAPNSCPVACQQLAPDSDLLRTLNAGDETPSGPEWVSIWTTDDEVVVPPDSATLAGALDFAVQDVCASASIGHGGLPRDPAVVGIVLGLLGVDLPTEPTNADC